MTRRGWVAAQTGADEWMRLQVFDDGWVELPGYARTLSDTRAVLRKKLLVSLILLGTLGLTALYAQLVTRLQDPPTLLVVGPPLVLGLVLLGWVVYFSVWEFRMGWRNRDQLEGDRRRRYPCACR